MKKTDTAGSKGYDAVKKVSGIKRPIGVDSKGPPHTIAVTTAEVMDRKGALHAMRCCKGSLETVQSVLADSGYVGQPFAQGGREALGEATTVQIAKRSELHKFAMISSAGWSSTGLHGWRKTDDYGKTANDGSTACSSSTWRSW